MHGKIMVYITGTGRGTVMNLAKVFFDFNKNNWTDKKSVPRVGLFVEFHASGQAITNIKPSKFQEFKPNDFISEQDFWKSEDDNELEDLQSKRRGDYITSLYRSTDFSVLDKLPVNITVPQSVHQYFAEELIAVETLQDAMDKEQDLPFILDYFIVKRFLNKALDTLFFMDSSIPQSEFMILKNIIARLESSYNTMSEKEKKLNIEGIFKDHFLSLQCHYQALVAMLGTQKDRATSIEKELKTLKLESALATKDEAKIKLRQERQIKLSEELSKMNTQITHLEKLKNEFFTKNLAVFTNSFKMTRQKLFSNMVEGLNQCATLIDMKICQFALKSSGIKNAYFLKNNMENSFSCLSFAELYLNRLDKKHLNPNDQKLNFYLQTVLNKHRKYFLIVSNNPALVCDLKIQIFKLSPYYLVKNSPKKVNYQALMREFQFDLVYIDEKTTWENTADIILEGKRFDKSGKTKFKLI